MAFRWYALGDLASSLKTKSVNNLEWEFLVVKAKSYSLWEGLHLPLKILKNGKWLLLIYYLSSTQHSGSSPLLLSDNPSYISSLPFHSQRATGPYHSSKSLPSTHATSLLSVPCLIPQVTIHHVQDRSKAFSLTLNALFHLTVNHTSSLSPATCSIHHKQFHRVFCYVLSFPLILIKLNWIHGSFTLSFWKIGFWKPYLPYLTGP